MSNENQVVLRLKRNPLLYYTNKGPSLYPQVFEYGVQSELQNIRLTQMYDEITEIPNITENDVQNYKIIRASSLPHYKNSFYGKYDMWNKHPLSPNFKILDTDATNTGSFIHLLFEHNGLPPENTYFCIDWGTSSRANSKKYEKVREEVGYSSVIVNSDEKDLCLDIYERATKELEVLEKEQGFVLGTSFEQNRFTISNYLNTGWSLSGSMDRVYIDNNGIHHIRDIKSIDPSQLSEWESGSYGLAAKFSQLEAYRILYSHKYEVPMENIEITLVLVIRNLKNNILGQCVKILKPSIQHTQWKLESFENMFKDLTSFFDARVENKPFGVDIVKYKPLQVKIAPDMTKYNTLFKYIKQLCEQQEIELEEGQDYFEMGEYKVLTYKFLIKILYKLGYEANVITVRDGDNLKYISVNNNLYERNFECNSLPSDKILYYCCEIRRPNENGILSFQRYTDSEVQDVAKQFGQLRTSYYWNNFYNQMANVTVIKHTIRTFMFDNNLLKAFLELESMTYEGLKVDNQ